MSELRLGLMLVLVMLSAENMHGQENDITLVASRIDESLSQLRSFHVKWECSSRVVSDVDSVESRRFSYNGHDEYAVSGEKRFRRWVRLGGEVHNKNTVYERIAAFDGSVAREKGWTTTPPDSPEFDNGFISKGTPKAKRTLAFVEGSNLFMNSVGSFFYDGDRLDCWRRMQYELNKMDVTPSRPFSIPAALKHGNYKVSERDVEVLGAMCWRVEEDEGRDILWLDPKRGFAIVKREWMWNSTNQPMYRYENSDFSEVISELLWLPRKCTQFMIASPKHRANSQHSVQVINQLEVVDWVVNEVPEELFQFEFPAGMYIRDDTRLTSSDGKPQPVSYTAGRDPKATQRSLDAVIARMRPHRRNPWLFPMTVVGFLLVIAICVVVRRRKGAS